MSVNPVFAFPVLSFFIFEILIAGFKTGDIVVVDIFHLMRGHYYCKTFRSTVVI